MSVLRFVLYTSIISNVFLLSCISTHHTFIKSELFPESSCFIIVFPFENLSSHQNGGDIATANFITELRSAFHFKILDAEFLVIKDTDDNSNLTSETDLSLISMYTKIKLAMKKKADFIITGKVCEFKYKKGLGEEPVVGLNVQMIDVKSRNIVWHSSISVTRGPFGIGEHSLNNYCQRAVHQMLKKLE
jgi:TolB-like protein